MSWKSSRGHSRDSHSESFYKDITHDVLDRSGEERQILYQKFMQACETDERDVALILGRFHDQLIEEARRDWRDLKANIEKVYRRRLQRELDALREEYQERWTALGTPPSKSMAFSEDLGDVFLTSPSQQERMDACLREEEEAFHSLSDSQKEEACSSLLLARRAELEEELRAFQREYRAEKILARSQELSERKRRENKQQQVEEESSSLGLSVNQTFDRVRARRQEAAAFDSFLHSLSQEAKLLIRQQHHQQEDPDNHRYRSSPSRGERGMGRREEHIERLTSQRPFSPPSSSSFSFSSSLATPYKLKSSHIVSPSKSPRSADTLAWQELKEDFVKHGLRYSEF